MREVQNKWQTLKMNDDIWSKLIYLEQNRRLAKAYVSTPVLTIDGSTSGLDGFRIGLSGIENTYRSLDSIASLRSIGHGIKLRIDGEGNILIHRIGPMPSGSACSIWVKDWPPAESYNCPSPISSSSLSDSYTSASSSSSSSSSASTSPYLENWNVKKLSCDQTSDEMSSFKLFDMKKFRAQLERQRRQQYAGLGEGEQRQLVDWRQCVSIITFARNNISDQASGTQITKQLLAEDKLNRNPHRILKESCWLMLINIIAIDMLKSVLCDNKSTTSIGPIISPSKAVMSKKEAAKAVGRYELATKKKNNGFAKTSLAQQNFERANSRILEGNEDELGNDLDDRFSNHQHLSNSNINRNIKNSYGSKGTNVERTTTAKHPASARLKSSSSVASLHPPSGEKTSSPSSGAQLADYLLFPTGNLINYFSNGRKNAKASISNNSNFGRQSSSGNLFSLSKQISGLSSSTSKANGSSQLGTVSDSQRRVDQIYSKSDYISFNGSGNLSRGAGEHKHSSSQQHLNYGLRGRNSAARNYHEYNQEISTVEDEDAIYTTFTGKYSYINGGKSRRAPLDESIYSTGAALHGELYSSGLEISQNHGSAAGLDKHKSSTNLYPAGSQTQLEPKLGAKSAQAKGKSATLGQQSRSNFDLSHGHKLDLRQLRTPTSIKMNFDSDEEDPLAAGRKPVSQTSVRSRRAFDSFNKKAIEWSRLAKRFAVSGKSSSSRISSAQQDKQQLRAELEPNYCKKPVLSEKEKTSGRKASEELYPPKVNQKKISRSSIVSSSSSSGCPENDYFLSQSSMSSSSSTERSATNDGNASSSSQPASSSGIVCSGNTSDDCCAERSRDASGGLLEGEVLNTSEDSSKSARPSRKSLGHEYAIEALRRRSISKDRYNNVKTLDGPQINCDHYELSQEIVCDCQDCGYEQQQNFDDPETGGFTSCDCCCDCFNSEPHLMTLSDEHFPDAAPEDTLKPEVSGKID